MVFLYGFWERKDGIQRFGEFEAFDNSAVFFSAGFDIDSCSADAAVTKNICKFCDVLGFFLETESEELAEVMREDLTR